MSIRVARTGDAPAIARLVGALRALEGVEGIPETEAVVAYLDNPDTRSFVADEDGEVVGLVTTRTLEDLFHGRPSVLIQELFVDGLHRGAGLGGRLLDAAIAHAFRIGAAEISVSTGDENTAAHRLYRSRAFDLEGVVFERQLPAG